MIPELTTNLCAIARKLITLLENELDNLSSQEQIDDMATKKRMIDMLNKLTNITLHINKLSKEVPAKEYVISKEEDEAIIAEFLSRHIKSSS